MTKPASLRLLKILVVTLGVLIIGGFAVVVTEITRRVIGAADTGAPTTAAPFTATLALPVGAHVTTVATASGRLAIVVRLPDGGDRLYFVDPTSGTVTGTLGVSDIVSEAAPNPAGPPSQGD